MRILAPLLVLTLIGTVVVRWISDPVADRDRAWITGSWDLASQRADVKERLVARLEALEDRDGEDAETRWFAARAWLKLGEIGRALDAVWTAPALADAPGTAQRFGSLLLRGLGFLDDERLTQPRRGAAMAALILGEGGDAEAAAWLDQTIRTRLEGGYFNVLYGTFFYASEAGARRVAEALRACGEPVAEVLAALTALRPETYPERTADLERLEEIVLRDADRQRQHIVWASACIALGRSEDTRALDVLAGLHAGLARSADERSRIDAGVVAAGLLAGGRWSMTAALTPFLAPDRARSGVRIWYAEALQHRLAQGDPEATDAWLAVWDSFRAVPDPRLAERVANGLLLREAEPPTHFPLDRVLGVLEAQDATATMRAIADAWRYRQGATAGRDALLANLRRLQEDGWPGNDLLVRDALWISPVLVAGRALTLYDPATRP